MTFLSVVVVGLDGGAWVVSVLVVVVLLLLLSQRVGSSWYGFGQ